MERLEKLLRERCPLLELRVDEPMSKHTTFRIGGPAALMGLPKSAGEARMAVKAARELAVEPFFLGNGSNLLVRDKGIRGAVVQLSGRMSALETDGTALYAEGGALLSAAAAKAAE